MRCSIDETKCQFTSNMKDRPTSRCLKYDDASECPIWTKCNKNKSHKAKNKAKLTKLNNYDY